LVELIILVPVFLSDGNHRLGAASTYPFQERGALLGWPAAATGCPSQNNGKGPIVFGADVWVGRGAVFVSGVQVGHGAVVGTRAVVTKDVPPYAVVAGNPARVVRQRFSADTQARLLKVRNGFE
jgi:acetyltransferase-like isoleucine patch superfamily enzyme